MSPKSWWVLLKGDAIKGTFQHLLELRNGRKDKPRQISLSPSYAKAHLIKKNHKLFNKRKRIYVWKCIMYTTEVKYVCTHRQTCIYVLWDTYLQIIPFWSHFGINQCFPAQSVSNTPEARVKCHDCHTVGAEILEPAPNPSHRRHFQCLGGHDGGCGCFWKSDYDRQWTKHRNLVT